MSDTSELTWEERGGMTEPVLTAVFAALVLNLGLAVVVCARRAHAGSWLLVILLAGTTGAALAAVLAVLSEDLRFLDVALVLTGTAVLTAAVRAAARRRGAGPAPPAHQRAGGST